MVSTSSSGPILVPLRRCAQCGDRLMLSCPPATTAVASPALIACSPSATARRPEPQTWLMVSAVRSTGMPASTAACRAGFCPAPAVSTWPRITSDTSAASTFARSSASLIAIVPSSCAGSVESPPLNAPTDVRAAAAMTTSVMDRSSSAPAGSREAPDRVGPALLQLLERPQRGGLHVLPGTLAGVPHLVQQLVGLRGVLAQGGDRLLVAGAGLGPRPAEPLLVLLDLRLPDRDLALDQLRELLLQCHVDPPRYVSAPRRSFETKTGGAVPAFPYALALRAEGADRESLPFASDRWPGVRSRLPTSVQLHVRLGPAAHGPRQRAQDDLRGAVHGPLVHLVERAVHQPGEVALDHQPLAGDEAHQVADRAVLAQAHQRAEVAVDEGLERLAAQPAPDLPDHVARLLVGGLGPRRHRPGVPLARAGGAVAHGEDVRVARGLERGQHHELVAPAHLEAVEVRQHIRTPDTRGPDHELRRDEAAVG